MPHYDTTVGTVDGRTFGSVQITASSAEDLVARFRSAAYTVMKNPHFTPDHDS
jgi:hydrogenase maturation factor HypE